MPSSANIVVIAEDHPLPAALSQALSHKEFHIQRIDLATAAASGQILDQADGVVVAARDISSPQWTELARVLDSLESRNIASLVMLPEEHQGRPISVSRSDGLICMSTTDSAEEIWARLSTIAGHRSVIRHLENELSVFYRRQPKLALHLGELDEEMRLASRLQRDFLPRTIPEVPPVSFEILFQPCGWVSGDIYDVFRLDEETLGFHIVDVVGHGMPAALLTIFIKRALQTKRIADTDYQIIPPEESLTLLNQDLVEQNLAHCQFATACYCTLNIKTLQLDVARAGHPYPLLIRSDRTIVQLGQAGALLGVLPGEIYHSASYRLAPGDKLLMYSDGLEDALFEPVTNHDERHYAPDFLDILDLDIKDLLPNLSQQIAGLTPPGSLRDDMTVVALQIDPK